MIKSRLEVNPLILAEPEPEVYVDSINESSLGLSIFAWTARAVFFEVRKKIVEDIKLSLDNAGIEIPFPQRVIHFAKDSNKFPQSNDNLRLNNRSKIHEDQFPTKRSERRRRDEENISDG